MKNAPWAKFTTVSMPKISDRPTASSAYTAPSATPVTSCSAISDGVTWSTVASSGLEAQFGAAAQVGLARRIGVDDVEHVVLALHVLGGLGLHDDHGLHRLVVASAEELRALVPVVAHPGHRFGDLRVV